MPTLEYEMLQMVLSLLAGSLNGAATNIITC
jgi:hypothetical protein